MSSSVNREPGRDVGPVAPEMVLAITVPPAGKSLEEGSTDLGDASRAATKLTGHFFDPHTAPERKQVSNQQLSVGVPAGK